MKQKGILIFIDDDVDDRLLFTTALSEIWSGEVRCASNGQEGLSLIRENLDNIFLIICDINMPKLNGFEMKKIIEGTPELKLKSIPFFFHSTTDNPLIIKEAYTLGIQGYLKKAITYPELLDCMRHLIMFWNNVVLHPNELT